MPTWFRANTEELTAARVRELLHYDPETGITTRRVATSPRAPKGGVVGDLDGRGYLRVRLDSKRYSLHRVIWLYMTGEWPKGEVDHKNRTRTDNRWANLRDATVAQNRHNSCAHANTAHGLKGVDYHKANKRWRARITSEGRNMLLGYFKTAEEAHAAYADAAQRFNGEFARAA